MNTTSKVYAYILDYCMMYQGRFPAIRHIQKQLGLSSSSVVAYHLNKLTHQGKLVKDPAGWAVVGGVWLPPN